MSSATSRPAAAGSQLTSTIRGAPVAASTAAPPRPSPERDGSATTRSARRWPQPFDGRGDHRASRSVRFTRASAAADRLLSTVTARHPSRPPEERAGEEADAAVGVEQRARSPVVAWRGGERVAGQRGHDVDQRGRAVGTGLEERVGRDPPATVRRRPRGSRPGCPRRARRPRRPARRRAGARRRGSGVISASRSPVAAPTRRVTSVAVAEAAVGDQLVEQRVRDRAVVERDDRVARRRGAARRVRR